MAVACVLFTARHPESGERYKIVIFFFLILVYRLGLMFKFMFPNDQSSCWIKIRKVMFKFLKKKSLIKPHSDVSTLYT